MAKSVQLLTVKIGGDITEALQALDGLAVKSKKLGEDLSKVGKTLSARVTLPIMAMGTGIVSVAADFERSMNRVQALTGSTGGEFAELRDLAAQLGAETMYSASQAADAMGFLAMAGFDANQIVGALPNTLQLAAAAQLDLAQAADITTNILTGYGLETEQLAHANDVLVKAFTSANTDLGQLGEAMKYAGPVASGLGIQFEEATAAIGMFSNAGIQGGMAGTSLRGALSRLAKPTGEAAGTLKRLGVQTSDSTGAMYPLVDIVRQLEESGATAADMMAIFGQRAGPAMMALVGQGSAALADFTAELVDSGGTAERIADKQMEGFHGMLLELESAVEGLALAIADSGLLDWATGLAERATEMFRSLSELNPEILKWGTVIAGVAAAIGPLLLGLGGMLKLVPLITAAVTALWTAITGPFALVAAALGGMAALYIHVRNKTRRAKEATDEYRESLKLLSSQEAANELERLAQNASKLEEEIRKTEAQIAKAATSTQTFGAAGANVRLEQLRTELEETRVTMGMLEERMVTAADGVDEVTDAIVEIPDIDLDIPYLDTAAASTTKVADAITDLKTQIATATAMSGLLGEQFDFTRARAEAYGQAVRALVAAGVDLNAQVGPQGETLRELADRYLDLEAEAEAAAEAQKLYETRVSAAQQAVSATITEEERHLETLEALRFALAEGAITQDEYTKASALIEGQLDGTSAALDEFKRLIGATKTEEEKLAEVQERLNLLLENGEITQEEYTRALEQATKEIDRAAASTENFGRESKRIAAQSTDAFVDFAFGAKNAISDFVSSALRSLAKLAAAKIFKMLFAGSTGGLGGILGGLFGGFFADGGFLKPGQWGVVGEQGPELVFGGRTGVTVEPAMQQAPAASASVGPQFNAGSVAEEILARVGPPPSYASPEVAATDGYYRRLFGAMVEDGRRRGVVA